MKVSKAQGPDILWYFELQFYTVFCFCMSWTHSYSVSVLHKKATPARPSLLYNIACMELNDYISSVGEVIDLLLVCHL